MPPPPPVDRPRVRHVIVLGLLATFGPISLDLYLPVLPDLAADLHSSTSAAQLSITACLVGLATGQLVAGPLSDRYGRRRPLLIGLAAYLLASLACALSPTITLLLLLRLIQGLCGAAGLVISRAISRDLYSGRSLVVFFARLMLISGMAPVLAPVIGGQLSRVMGWRGIFVVLGCFGLVLLLAGAFGTTETLPPERRTTGGLGSTLRRFRVLLADRFFVGAALACGFAGASMFAYIAGATFVLQELYGLSPQGFSLVFAANSIGIVLLGQLGGRLARDHDPVRVLTVGIGLNLLGSAAVAGTAVLHLGLPFLVGSLFVMVSAVGLIFPTSTALALADYPEQAGAASSLLGLGQYLAGAIAAPLVGLAGAGSALPLGLVVLAASLCATTVLVTLVLPGARSRRTR